jgi:hypothetical protein
LHKAEADRPLDLGNLYKRTFVGNAIHTALVQRRRSLRKKAEIADGLPSEERAGQELSTNEDFIMDDKSVPRVVILQDSAEIQEVK